MNNEVAEEQGYKPHEFDTGTNCCRKCHIPRWLFDEGGANECPESASPIASGILRLPKVEPI